METELSKIWIHDAYTIFEFIDIYTKNWKFHILFFYKFKTSHLEKFEMKYEKKNYIKPEMENITSINFI